MKSHIIPRSFFKSEGYVAITSNAAEYKKRIPTGPYDEDILCLDCEKKFCAWDTYGNEFLNRTELPTKPFKEGDEGKDYFEAEFDYAKLKMFFLSVLWRGHHSRQEFFFEIKLDLHEKRIREMIIANDPKKPDDYSVILSKFDEDPGIISAQYTNYDRINCYRLYIPGYKAIIKVDKRPMKDERRELILSPEKKAIIFLINALESKERNVMKKRIKNYNLAHPKP